MLKCMAAYDNCGGHITDRFRRVFGDNGGVVHGCPDCMAMTEILNGETANAE